MRPLIGIPGHSDYRAESRRPIYCNNRAYTHAIEHAGGIPLLIPLLDDLTSLEKLLPRLDGILLTGGVDIQPSLYGEKPHPLIDVPDVRLDEFELAITRWALEADLPTLGVCRGMQLLNVALGGDLYQDLDDQYPGNLRHCRRELPRTQISHCVYIEPGSRMEAVLGTRELWVNSLHHQAVKHAGKGVRISGRAEDGVAELLEVPEYTFVLAAQCHPEEIYTVEPACARLFKAFVQACGGDIEDEMEEQTWAPEIHEVTGQRTR
jgi:putative glutamine amidotransferase